MALYVLALAGGLRELLRPDPAAGLAERALVLFLWATLVWVLAVGTLLEVGENYRFRWATDPFAVALAARSIRGALRRVRPA